MISKTVDVSVTSVLQTTAGKMILKLGFLVCGDGDGPRWAVQDVSAGPGL